MGIVCDVCGEQVTHVIRYGGRLSNGVGITGPNLYGCNDHLVGDARKLGNLNSGSWISKQPNIHTKEIEVMLWE